MAKRYSDCYKLGTPVIASECIQFGYSDGWVGSKEELEEAEKILTKFNIHYVCDFKGKWAYREPETINYPSIH